MVAADSMSVTDPPRPGRLRLPAQVSRMAAAVFVAMCLAGALFTWLVYSAEMTRRQAQLDEELFEAARLVETRIEQHIAFLTATRAFLATRPQRPDRATFWTFVKGLSLRGDYSGLQGVGVSIVLEPGQEDEVAAGILANYDMERPVWPEPVDGLRTAIVLLEPADARNLAAIGYDMATEERRREAMLRALETGEPAATAPLILVQEITPVQQTGILVYLPFRRSGEMRGFVYSPIRMGDLFDAAFSGHTVPIEVRALDAESPDLPLYSTPGFEEASDEGRPTAQTMLSVGGREWVLQAIATEGFVASEWPRFTILAAVAFALLALATGAAAQNQSTAVRRAEALNAQVERNVTQKDFLLREMSHRIKNSIGRTMAIVRQSSSSAATREEFVESVTIRLRAMAAAQDLLIASGTDRADLADLLTSELDQLYGGKARPHVMEGPPVSLDAQQTLALGLAVHELATNSLKYGAGTSPEGELKVTWTIEQRDAGRDLVIVWDEFLPEGAPMHPVLPSAGSGFGTKMIDACIRSDLGGTLERRMHAEGFVVEMRVPLD